MPDNASTTPKHMVESAERIVSRPRNFADKHKYVLSFWLMAVAFLAMMFFAPPLHSHPVAKDASAHIQTVQPR